MMDTFNHKNQLNEMKNKNIHMRMAAFRRFISFVPEPYRISRISIAWALDIDVIT